MTSMKNFSETRVLVTGGNGFIGSHLTERLVSLNADVSVFSRSGNSIKINDLIKKIKFFKVDLTNKDLFSVFAAFQMQTAALSGRLPELQARRCRGASPISRRRRPTGCFLS